MDIVLLFYRTKHNYSVFCNQNQGSTKNTGLVPEAWSIGKIIPIYKQKGDSWGTKERFWLTLAPENNTAKLYMVENVIIWGI